MKPIDYKEKYLRLVKSIVTKESIAEINYNRALRRGDGTASKTYDIGLTAGKMEALTELLDEIKEPEYSEKEYFSGCCDSEIQDQDENVKSSDFYPCADENGMVGR